MRASLSAPSAPTSDFVGRIKLENVGDLELYNVLKVRTASSWDARARRKLQSVGAEAFGTHQVEDWPVVCFNPEWCFIPNCLQFQKFLPCSLLYILAAQ